MERITRWGPHLGLVVAALLFGAGDLAAHCDGLDGPVVEAGREALSTGDVSHALVWVLPRDEAEVRAAFDHAVQVRQLGQEARALADRFFFETLVRVHRAGEGEPYTGLKAAGRDLGPVIPAADRALATGSSAELEALVLEQVRAGIRERFDAAVATRDFAPGDVGAGRAFVRAYVPFLHYAERVFEAAAGGAHGHSQGNVETAVESADDH